MKKEDITVEEPSSYTPEIEKIIVHNRTVEHEHEGLEKLEDPFSEIMNQDHLADAVKQEDTLSIQVESADA